MPRTRQVPCTQGTCGAATLECWHPGDPVDNDNVVLFLVTSYSMWGWKIGEAVMPRPVAAWMYRRRKDKRKRQKQKEARRALRNSRGPARV